MMNKRMMSEKLWRWIAQDIADHGLREVSEPIFANDGLDLLEDTVVYDGTDAVPIVHCAVIAESLVRARAQLGSVGRGGWSEVEEIYELAAKGRFVYHKVPD